MVDLGFLGESHTCFCKIFDTFWGHFFQEASKPVLGRILQKKSMIFCFVLPCLTIDAQAKNISFGCYLLHFNHIGPFRKLIYIYIYTIIYIYIYIYIYIPVYIYIYIYIYIIYIYIYMCVWNTNLEPHLLQ